MNKLSDAELAVLEVLWGGESFALGELVEALRPVKGWSRNTVYTYLTRMEAKSLVAIDRPGEKPYSAAVKKEDWAKAERDSLLKNVYGGAAGDLVAAFLKEAAISTSERERLRKLLDEMEV